MSSDKIYTLVFLVTAFPPEVSGASYTNWERVQWLAKQGMYRVVVFAPDWQHEKPNSSLALSDLDEKLIIERYPSKPWPPYHLTHVPRFPVARQINEKLAYYQPDLITMTDVERFFLLSTWQLPGRHYAKQHRIPYLAEYHTDIYNFSATYPGWQWLRGFVRTSNLTKHLYHPFDSTICFSQAASKSCQDMGISHVHTMPYGIDLSMCSPNRRHRQWLKPWLSEHEQEHKVLLFLGRLGFEKRVDLLIEAFAKLKSQQPNCSLIIAGDGPLNVVNQLKRLAAPVPDIHFTGFLLGEAKANLLASCDLFCSPSPYETFGRTIVEAMASGIPVVTVNSGAVSEYLFDGLNGYLVPPDDVEGLAHGISQALSTNNLEIIHRALQDVKQFSFEQGCQNLHHYYQQLLGLNHDSKDLINLSKI
ncbi:glycosyltransferase [Gloeocapsopsis dulcis]|uniref:Group 1 glycosyl transferase n=1 Tax=Gloeocapsopsis dulcis AAB1 = 1H9 TaxID=1433147 RepID=A0A6N8FSS3_9CHRO|nr:glycosyltransferase [Gloeocapsopsis dulcis]MUL35991.1 group 1 glycosyl transferase [Gloeocapsopsis dulcis AAB1 = 1H9]